MFSFISDILTALESDLPFKVAFKRLQHLRYGCPFKSRVYFDKLRSESHPNSNREFVYTINMYTCSDCGLSQNSVGLEFRDGKFLK